MSDTPETRRLSLNGILEKSDELWACYLRAERDATIIWERMSQTERKDWNQSQGLTGNCLVTDIFAHMMLRRD